MTGRLTVLVVASRRDPAAQNIAQELIRLGEFQPTTQFPGLFESGSMILKYVDSEGIYAEDLGIDFKPEAIIFASKHRSASGEPTLTVHWTGNGTSQSDFGGKPKSLSYTDPSRLRAGLLALDEARETMKLNFSVTLEATHHGPTELEAPTMFVEIGSTEREWNDQQAAKAAAQAIWKAATAPIQGEAALGFGGGHYCNKHCTAVRKDGYAFGHILSKYFFEEYDEEVVHAAFKRTLGGCRKAIIDWKGLRAPDREKLLLTLKQMNIEVIRV